MPETSRSGLLARCQQLLDKREANSARRRLTLPSAGAVDFSSNDFLSLSRSDELRAAYIAEVATVRGLPLGSGGSRLLDGNCQYAEQLETTIAAFHNAPAGLLFNSGFDANAGMFACLPQPDDVIVYDEYIHASVHEGMRLSRAAEIKAFRHNDMGDFRLCLSDLRLKYSNLAAGVGSVIVAVESVYSMDGDIAPIQEILDVLQEILPSGNGHLIVDEAHSTGVYGRNGRGLVCDLGVEDRVLARLHTFGKALSSGGAIVLCSSVLKDYLINYARSLVYTTALGLPTLAMIKCSYEALINGRTLHAQQKLWSLIRHFNEAFSASDMGDLVVVSPNPPTSPIFSLCTDQPRSLARYCQERGFVVRPIVPPTVPQGASRVRVCLHAGNTYEEIDRLAQCVETWVRESGRKTNGEETTPVITARL